MTIPLANLHPNPYPVALLLPPRYIVTKHYSKSNGRITLTLDGKLVDWLRSWNQPFHMSSMVSGVWISFPDPKQQDEFEVMFLHEPTRKPCP